MFDGGDCCHPNVDCSYCLDCNCHRHNNTTLCNRVLATPTCTSGLSKLMVVHGDPNNSINRTTIKSEVMDVENVNIRCEDMKDVIERSLSDYRQNSVGGFVSGRPVVCRPHAIIDLEGSEQVNECFSMNKSGVWKFVASLEVSRTAAFGLTVVNESSQRLWITGVYFWPHFGSVPFYYNSTEFLTPQNNFANISFGPDLPYITDGHCILDMKNGKMLLTGGEKLVFLNNEYTKYERYAWTWLLDVAGNSWTECPSLINNRARHSCGLVKDSVEETPIAVVSGGQGALSNNVNIYFEPPLKQTEILYTESIHGSHWLRGPDLPIPLTDTFHSTTADMKQFIVGGGSTRADFYSTSENVHSLYRLQCFSLKCDWSQMKQKLKYPRPRQAVAILLPSDYKVNCKFMT